jgi:hypothetical protein
MNRRLYFILPDVETSRKVEQELLLARIEERRMHFLGKRGTDLQDLPEATSTQKSDLLHGAFIGLFVGGVTGAAAGFGLYLYPEIIGLDVKQIVILIGALVGAGLGAWIGGPLIGSSTPNVHLAEYQESMKDGHILLMLDVPVERVDEVRAIIKSHHPEAEDHGIEPTMPAFP